ncbi:RAD50-interacting protein 1 isoform X1 [Danaus plexippus]|uniref:RAD50-interacting protein 1 isoform X1 n=1 Tax=Danaus plexippus TaxID=13037 RepID=UPI002AB07BFC|nr:RAD50-interacting protein 1 isoform X1 [Danaus plexippus]
MKSHLKDDVKKEIIQKLNYKIGGDINNLVNAYEVENECVLQRNQLKSLLNAASDEVPNKLSSAIAKAECNSQQIDQLREKRIELMKKVDGFIEKTQPLMSELNKRFADIGRLEEVLSYFKSYARIEELSNQMKQCKDDEQLVAMFGEMKEMCSRYKQPHQQTYIKDYTHYWHNILKDNFTRNYEDVLKVLKWPFTSQSEIAPTKEVMSKFTTVTRHLFLVQEPKSMVVSISGDFSQETEPSLPIKLLLKPLKKRFIFHFTGSRQTARIDRPEWFLTQTLTWIKDHQDFVKNHVQPIAEKLNMKNVNTVDEFNVGIISLAAERLHTVLGIYHTQTKHVLDVDAAFAHAVDETLGFHRELVNITGGELNSVLSVLTRAETFVRWLAVEKKYALSKMDETLDNSQWIEPVASGVVSAVGSVLWVPRGADWFIALLKTIEDRYAMLPQPGHRLQFLELQLELIEEWRIRLTQLLGAAMTSLTPDTFLTAGPHPLIAIINTAHHTRNVLLQWANSLHYLQLHYYKRQFQHFTQQQHKEESDESVCDDEYYYDEDDRTEDTRSKDEDQMEEALSLNDVEVRAKKMALNEIKRRNSVVNESQYDVPGASPSSSEVEEGAVFCESPALLAHLRDAGIAALAEHILLEFKATIREYKKQKWHSMVTMEQAALSVSAPLCAPLSGAISRAGCAAGTLSPRLAEHLMTHLAACIDMYLFEEVVLESWFNTGGTLQFTHDVKRNLVPAFAPANKNASKLNHFPRLLEACKLLNLDYDDARRLRSHLSKQPNEMSDYLTNLNINHIKPAEALRILNQRTDLADTTSPSSVMELF